ncbi:hypothetical protein JIX56_04090 [Streptomyces sp. CA-210063]|uniref:hypothetical protein n=1 Tax=Streptomyces sp. CA-210063 TaxID=2801029 RepID=UPI00214C897F|nr:hypothetical protein [Streptomyces sp. CA-210063]UUU29145.1 hypothetical protein JIX56_04090 [Streptomyces sp. CA-210063]
MSTNKRVKAFHWEMYRRSGRVGKSDLGTYVFATLVHVFGVFAAYVTEPLAGLIVGGVFAAFWGSILLPPWLRDIRSIVAADIRPGPPPVLVLQRRNGSTITHPLGAVTELRPLTVGIRSAGGSGGDKILELRVGRKVYRTQAAFNPPGNEVQLLADALRRACPQLVVRRHEDRTSWVSDSE